MSGPLTGSGTFEDAISISELGITGILDTGDFNYFLIAFAKDEDGTTGTTSIDNLSFVVGPAPIPKGTVILVK